MSCTFVHGHRKSILVLYLFIGRVFSVPPIGADFSYRYQIEIVGNKRATSASLSSDRPKYTCQAVDEGWGALSEANTLTSILFHISIIRYIAPSISASVFSRFSHHTLDTCGPCRFAHWQKCAWEKPFAVLSTESPPIYRSACVYVISRLCIVVAMRKLLSCIQLQLHLYKQGVPSLSR